MVFEPWNASLRDRLGMLRNNTHRVAYFSPKPDSGSFRYRCYNTSQALNMYSRDVSASYFFSSDLDQLDDLSAFADTLVVFRTPYDTDVDRLITSFSRVGKKVFFDIDDLIFDVDFAPLVTSNLNYKMQGKHIDQWFSFIANIGACLKLCDQVITTTSFLAERVEHFSGLPVDTVPNFVNQEQLNTSLEIVAEKPPRDSRDSLRIGYFSGSHSHAKDFAVAQSGIEAFLESSPQSTLTVLGHLELPSRLASLKKRIIRKPFVNFLDLQRAISEVDINLSPLQLSPFTFSKSELKFFESALVGTITVASPTPVFTDVINHGVDGFISPASKWFETLRGLGAANMEELDAIAAAAHTKAVKLYSARSMEPRLTALFLGSK